MKFTASGVIFSAAIVRSPSFSRSSSSTTITIRPARIAATASSMEANGPGRLRAPLAISMRGFMFGMPVERQPGQLRRAHDVLADDVAFEVHAVAKLGAPEVRVLHRERHELHVEAVDTDAGDRQADA